MKALWIVFAFSLVLLFSCAKEEECIVNPDLLIGAWRLDQVLLNETDGTVINNGISNNTTLNIDDDKRYCRNYVVGKWSLNDEALLLDPGADLKEF